MTMTEKISVRLARDEDIGALAGLAARAFRDAFEADNHPSDIDSYLRNSLSFESVQAEFDDANNIFLIAYLEGNDIPADMRSLVRQRNIRTCVIKTLLRSSDCTPINSPLVMESGRH